jgi:SNF2 family DNA or RNA helicase
MNLTAADAAVHLDPWWNPAVEDQATDRAHRIGQTRPVTIVRLVTEGTIEEKVLALHGRKRALYEDVVGAADGAGPLDVEALAQLLGASQRASKGAPSARG